MDLFNEGSMTYNQSMYNITRRQCRICLTELAEAHHCLCACKGHLQNMHVQCLLQWLRRTTTDQDLQKGVKECQICKEQMLLNVSKSYRFRNLSDVCNNNDSKGYCDLDTKWALLLCLFFTPLITMIGVIINYSQSQKHQPQLLYLIISMASISLFALVCLIRCIFIKERYELNGIQEKDKHTFKPKNKKVANGIL